MKKIELLAPAKNFECGISAIKCGADAVYIGADKFGARSSAGNSLEDIKKLIEFAHIYNAKVYVTINIILNDEEILEAQQLVKDIYEIGADAIIIQDMGFLELDLPPIPIHASTQVHNNTAQKVKFLEDTGFRRVILARELSLDKIKEIRKNTNIELEFFIHGALCVCYSGQCYLSYAIGGRSGNRGECAQPCRKKYSVKTLDGKFLAEDKYLLSLKDLNLSDYITDLIDAGITSFKIEGRLKDETYIKNIVSFYNKTINEAIADNNHVKRASSGTSNVDFIANPYKTFNRDYTDYFISGRTPELSSFYTPKSIGEPIGKVLAIRGKTFVMEHNSPPLNNGDGLCYFDEDGTLQGTVVNTAEDGIIVPNDMKTITKDTFIYRNSDNEFQKKLKNSQIERKIRVKISFTEENNELILQFVDEDGNKCIQKIKNTFEIAQNQVMAIENIKKQFSKLGETVFSCAGLDINLKNIYFIPVKTLNELRRKLSDDIYNLRQKEYKQEKAFIEKNEIPYVYENLDFRSNVLNKYAESFYRRHGVVTIEPAAESGLRLKNKTVMTTKYCIKFELGLCAKQNPSTNLKNALTLVDEQKKEYLLDFDCADCEMNIIF